MATIHEQAETSFTTPTDLELFITRTFDAPAARVFDAWTNPTRLPNWMLGPGGGWTMPVCEIDLRPGGAWRFGWRNSAGDEMSIRGTYREVARPTRLVSTESWGEDWPETHNTLVLAEHDGVTTVSQTILYPSQDTRDDALHTGMKQGIVACFDRLAAYLKTIE